MTTNKPIRRLARTVGESVLGEQRFRDLQAWLLQVPLEYRQLTSMRQRHLVAVKQPLALISQVQRSGGTLLSQLLDGHPECHAHPHELYIGDPDKYTWPPVALADGPEAWFEMLQEGPAFRAFHTGYKKATTKFLDEQGTLPFVFLPLLQRRLFLEWVRSHRPATPRDVLDAYMTSYFNAWLDNHNLYPGPKKYVTGFVPRMSDDDANVEKFFETYPDGFLVSIIRDPRGWYASARGHAGDRWKNVDTALDAWAASAEAMRRARKRYGTRVYLMTFERLVAETEASMKHLASFLGLTWSPTLLSPTFNGMPIKADSSYAVKDFGIVKATVSRYQGVLSATEIAAVERRAMSLYDQVHALTPEGS